MQATLITSNLTSLARDSYHIIVSSLFQVKLISDAPVRLFLYPTSTVAKGPCTRSLAILAPDQGVPPDHDQYLTWEQKKLDLAPPGKIHWVPELMFCLNHTLIPSLTKERRCGVFLPLVRDIDKGILNDLAHVLSHFLASFSVVIYSCWDGEKDNLALCQELQDQIESFSRNKSDPLDDRKRPTVTVDGERRSLHLYLSEIEKCKFALCCEYFSQFFCMMLRVPYVSFPLAGDSLSIRLGRETPIGEYQYVLQEGQNLRYRSMKEMCRKGYRQREAMRSNNQELLHRYRSLINRNKLSYLLRQDPRPVDDSLYISSYRKDEIEDLQYIQAQQGVPFDYHIEKSFLLQREQESKWGRIPHLSLWMGVLPLRKRELGSISALLKNREFVQSLPLCRGLYLLTPEVGLVQEVSALLRQISPVPVRLVERRPTVITPPPHSALPPPLPEGGQESTDQPVQESTDQPVQESTDQPVQESTAPDNAHPTEPSHNDCPLDSHPGADDLPIESSPVATPEVVNGVPADVVVDTSPILLYPDEETPLDPPTVEAQPSPPPTVEALSITPPLVSWRKKATPIVKETVVRNSHPPVTVIQQMAHMSQQPEQVYTPLTTTPHP